MIAPIRTMFQFFKRSSKAKAAQKYQMRFNVLWRQLVPVSHEADTVQGELLRSIGNLSDEAKRNGNMNWDEQDEEAVVFLETYLLNPDIFSQDILSRIKLDLNAIRRAGRGCGTDFLSAYEEIDRIASRVVDYCDMHKKPIRLRPEEDDYLGHY
ncbi:MAG: hypothetical protein LBI02_02195 [Opitutaceae bacterium]|nr:hypothetical protein [Opitutaceae bacterium]